MGQKERLIPFTDREEARDALGTADNGQEYVVIRRDSLESIYSLTEGLSSELYSKEDVENIVEELLGAIRGSIANGEKYAKGEADAVIRAKPDYFAAEKFDDILSQFDDILSQLEVMSVASSALFTVLSPTLEPSQFREALAGKWHEAGEYAEKLAKMKENANRFQRAIKKVGGLDRILQDNI